MIPRDGVMSCQLCIVLTNMATLMPVGTYTISCIRKLGMLGSHLDGADWFRKGL